MDDKTASKPRSKSIDQNLAQNLSGAMALIYPL